MPETRDVILKPVSSKKEGVILLDIYVNGQWCGSRRTLKQCELFLKDRLEGKR